MFTLQTSFKPLLLGGGGGGYNPLVEATVNSKEKNHSDFGHNYVQEFGLRLGTRQLYFSFPSLLTVRSTGVV